MSDDSTVHLLYVSARCCDIFYLRQAAVVEVLHLKPKWHRCRVVFKGEIGVSLKGKSNVVVRPRLTVITVFHLASA